MSHAIGPPTRPTLAALDGATLHSAAPSLLRTLTRPRPPRQERTTGWTPRHIAFTVMQDAHGTLRLHLHLVTVPLASVPTSLETHESVAKIWVPCRPCFLLSRTGGTPQCPKGHLEMKFLRGCRRPPRAVCELGPGLPDLRVSFGPAHPVSYPDFGVTHPIR